MNLEQITAELLAEPFDQFTAERNVRAKELKAAGQADLAKEVAALKKPPVHLWAANQLARKDGGLLRSLNESADAVARAQTGGKGAHDLRAASQQFQKNLEAAATQAAAVLKETGHSSTEETMRRLHDVFRTAVLTDRDAWERLTKGALLEEPQAGDNIINMFQAGKAVPQKKAGKAGQREAERSAAEERRREAEREAERVRELEATAKRLRQAAKDAAADAERAERKAKAAEQQAADAKAQLKKRSAP